MPLVQESKIDPAGVIAFVRTARTFPEVLASISFTALTCRCVQDNSDILTSQAITREVFDLLDEPPTR